MFFCLIKVKKIRYKSLKKKTIYIYYILKKLNNYFNIIKIKYINL